MGHTPLRGVRISPRGEAEAAFVHVVITRQVCSSAGYDAFTRI
jgi:hypothetical protein